MSGTDLEHRTEIRRASRTTPLWIGLVVLVATVALASVTLGDGEPDRVAPPTTVAATPTSETLTTTSPRRQPPVFAITDAGGHLRPISTAVGSHPTPGDQDPQRLRATLPIATAGRVVVLAEDGTILHAEPGQSFRSGACCFAAIHPSNEPGHVWARRDDRAVLIELDTVDEPRVVLVLGEERVLGPASFGLVTVDDRDVVRWHRPSFQPTVLGSAGGRRAIDAGGGRLLTVTSGEGAAPVLEVRSITDDTLLSTHALDRDAHPEGLLAPDGSVVLLPAPGGWVVRDAVSGLARGTLPKVTGPVWVGGDRFAATLDGQLVISDTGVLPMRWPVLAVAEQSP